MNPTFSFIWIGDENWVSTFDVLTVITVDTHLVNSEQCWGLRPSPGCHCRLCLSLTSLLSSVQPFITFLPSNSQRTLCSARFSRWGSLG